MSKTTRYGITLKLRVHFYFLIKSLQKQMDQLFFTSLWFLSCFMQLFFWLNNFPQILQLYTLSSCLFLLCSFKPFLFLYDDPHWSQQNLSSACSISWDLFLWLWRSFFICYSKHINQIEIFPLVHDHSTHSWKNHLYWSRVYFLSGNLNPSSA